MDTPVIVSVGNHGCIRQVKQAIGLRNKARMHFLTHKKPPMGQFFQTAMMWHNQGQLRSSLRLHENADLFHVHTEPFWFVMTIREVIPDAIVLLDIHDSMMYRFDEANRQSSEERAAVEQADGYVYVSDKCKEVTEGWVPSAAKKPSIILPSYVPERFYKLRCWTRVGGVVNEGRCDIMDAGDYYDYCKYHDLAKVFKSEGVRFTLYGGNGEERCVSEYKDADFMGHKPYEEMMKQLGEYDWGLCGNLVPYPEWDVAFPNKLFEYLAAGIPVVAMNAPVVGEFVEKHGIGISVSSVQELKARWDERERCQAEVFKKRYQWSMERNVEGLLALYQELLQPAGGNGRFRLPRQSKTQGRRKTRCPVSRPTMARA